MFQFTHPGGVRPELLRELREIAKVSIHAPGRGATNLVDASKRAILVVSIHAPGRGATTPFLGC